METRLSWNGTSAVMKIKVCKNRNSKFIYFPSHCEICAYGTIKILQNFTHGINVHFGLRLYKSPGFPLDLETWKNESTPGKPGNIMEF